MRYPTPALWRVRVTDVHDGDTVTAFVDRGHDEFATWDIRLKDVYAPELSQTGGPECREFVRQWVATHIDGSDWPLLLETFRTPRSDTDVMTFSRYVGELRSVLGTSLNADVQAFITANGYGGGIGA